jgi:hypothetical protein
MRQLVRPSRRFGRSRFLAWMEPSRDRRHQRRIRSSGKFTTTIRFAQGWQGFQARRRDTALMPSPTLDLVSALLDDTHCGVPGRRRCVG